MRHLSQRTHLIVFNKPVVHCSVVILIVSEEISALRRAAAGYYPGHRAFINIHNALMVRFIPGRDRSHESEPRLDLESVDEVIEVNKDPLASALAIAKSTGIKRTTVQRTLHIESIAPSEAKLGLTTVSKKSSLVCPDWKIDSPFVCPMIDPLPEQVLRSSVLRVLLYCFLFNSFCKDKSRTYDKAWIRPREPKNKQELLQWIIKGEKPPLRKCGQPPTHTRALHSTLASAPPTESAVYGAHDATHPGAGLASVNVNA
ncbi:hypothetical protein EVAR_31050_1 [Eumeta japonica]|uniref:Histone-lysine N-methyltransferase SETMAR n=1 Tax=Eumeta variegata TaxID=151549 RepID=A0A4C1VFH4_EUMVA|nr:hypothetical protein EVAR_31050_1 [Eumeta japonica]